jgi:glycosyltransferase involved in cell wall biosynthesis
VSDRSTWVVATHVMLPNGPGHRLVQALLGEGHDVAFCAVPLPGVSRWRAERMFPGEQAPQILVDEERHVPPMRELRSAVDLTRFAWQLARSGRREVVLVGCDPVSFLEAAVAFRSTPIRVRASAAWFVDWSAQRLQRRATAAAYRLATRGALRLADVTAAISPQAADAITRVGRPRRAIVVLANQPLRMGTGVAWSDRSRSVVYLGGLSQPQGVDVLLGAAAALAADEVAVDIIGDGPARQAVEAAVARIPGVRFHGLVGDADLLADVLLRARVGWALYDPDFPLHRYSDSLKIKDYLAMGMRIVSTLPTSVDDGVIATAQCSVAAVVDATRQALVAAPPFEPSTHPLLVDAGHSLSAFLAAVAAVR